MKTAKDLKEALANVPDDAILVVSDPDWNSADVVGFQLLNRFSGSPYDGKTVFFIDFDDFSEK